jgi:hypothetical protein
VGVAPWGVSWMTISATIRVALPSVQRSATLVALMVAQLVIEGIAHASALGIAPWATIRVAPCAVPWILPALSYPWERRRDSDSRSVGVLDCRCIAHVASGFVPQPSHRRVLRPGIWPAIHQQGIMPCRFGIAPQAQPTPPPPRSEVFGNRPLGFWISGLFRFDPRA